MLGALLIKRALAKGYAAVSRQDLDAIADLFHEDAVLEFPGTTVMSGRYEGRAAIRAWFERWFATMPETRFALRHVSVENIFALTASNVVHAEWDLDEADREGNRYHVTGVTAFVIEGGKTRTAKDYIFDQPLLASIWPSTDPAPADTEGRE
jgi:ketosteroid isomerase-like protein